MDGQDWTTTQIRNYAAAAKTAATLVPNAIASRNPEAAHLRKVADAEVPIKIKKLAPESRQEIVAKRAANKWSQQDLNQQCNFPVNTIREIEAGRLTPNIQQLNTLNRILKTGLRLQ
jgi:ribosome-binding protein aMBF1 (putative translation factor)